MPTVDERLASLEARVSEHSATLALWRETLTGFERRVDARFDLVDRRFEAIDRRFETIESRLSQHLLWTVGIQVTVLVVVIGAVITILTR